MRQAARLLLVTSVAIVAAVLLTFGQTMTSVVALMATVYIMKGTNSAFNPIPDSAYPQFAHDYIAAVSPPGPPAPTPVNQVGSPGPYVLVQYPASFWPITPPGYIFSPTYDQSVAEGVKNLETARPLSSTQSGDFVWGYSQGATVVTQYKRDYNAAYPTDPNATKPVPPTFDLVANPNRPNGGILERGVALGTIPIVGVTFSGATPTQTAGVPDGTITTYDIARQYDGIADAPTNPLNVLADANAVMGFALLHGQYPSAPLTGPNMINQGTYGDTQYYLIASYPLPLLMPLEAIPVVGYPLADTLDPALRVLVEAGYDRTTSPGVPTPFNPLYFPNPATLGTNFLVAIPTGLDNGISDFAGSRPFGTVRPGAFGVGGIPTPVPTPTPFSPPIPVMFSTPGGFIALLNPTTLLSDLGTFSQLTSILNGGLPASIPSPLAALAGLSGPNPTSALTNLGSVGGQNATGATTVVPATSSAPNDTTGTTLRSASARTPDSGVGERWAQKNSVNNDVAPGDTTNVSSQPQPSNDDPSNVPNPVRLNVPRNSFIATPGGSQSGTGSPNGASQPTGTNPIGSALSGVTSSIKSAIGGLSKAGTGGGTTGTK